MGFNGGSSGSTGVNSHKHTNAINDGSSLDTTSLLDDSILYSRILVGV